MGCYNRISSEEREKIYLLQKNNKTQLEIAFTLGRSQSSISYELARCKSDSCGYLPDRANLHATSRYKRHCGKLSNELKKYIVDYLKIGWTPEQISGRLKYEGSNLRISHETIYKFIYSDEGE
jgi:IS30 family transposase